MKIIAPTECPSCGALLERVVSDVAVTLMCPNYVDCPAQTGKRLEKFCKALSIKGFGPATLAKLPVTTVPEFLGLTVESFINAGFSDLMANKLHKELVDKTTKMPMDKFLEGLAITGFGATASKTVALTASSLAQAFTTEGVVSPRLTGLLQEFGIENPWIFDLEDRVVTSNVISNGTVPLAHPLVSLGTVVITGSLNDFKNRKEAGAYLAGLGYTVKDTVTKATTFLVCEDESKTNSSSYTKAVSLGINIGSINDLVERNTNG